MGPFTFGSKINAKLPDPDIVDQCRLWLKLMVSETTFLYQGTKAAIFLFGTVN